MGKRILILDDDADFNNLLTDIFAQANYDVVSERDPQEALDLFAREQFDMIVTDQKMPGLTGEQFIKKAKAIRPNIPVIMVSGYLDNDTIRELIEEGVGGVFLKPLNVFSLLKRTTTILEESETMTGPDAAKAAIASSSGTQTDFQHSLPFPFQTFPCRSKVSEDFASRLYSLRNFKTNVVFIAEKGAPLQELAADMENFEPESSDAFTIAGNDFGGAWVQTCIDETVTQGKKRLTLIIPNTEQLNAEERQLISQITRGEGHFENAAVGLRVIFCLMDEVDALYDEGKIDDELYLLLGTSEIRIPSLRLIPDDIPVLAQAMIAAKSDQDTPPRLQKEARDALKQYDWPGNYRELQGVVEKILAVSASATIGESEIASILSSAKKPKTAQTVNNLYEHLEQHANAYMRAMLILCGKDKDMAASAMGIPTERLEQL